MTIQWIWVRGKPLQYHFFYIYQNQNFIPVRSFSDLEPLSVQNAAHVENTFEFYKSSVSTSKNESTANLHSMKTSSKQQKYYNVQAKKFEYLPEKKSNYPSLKSTLK